MSKVPFKTLFPSKKLLNKILFQMDSELSSKKLLPLYETLYNKNELTSKDSPYVNNPNVIFLMNRVLVDLKKRTKQQPITLHRMELYLLKKAAQLGNNDAITLLCYQILSSNSSSSAKATATPENQNDFIQSQNLLKQLVKRKHPLSFKIVADLNCLMGQFEEAKRWYKEYLKAVKPYDNLRFNFNIGYWGIQQRGEVLERLGEIEFREGGINNIISCEKRFLKAIQLLPLKECVKSYFYLAMLYIKYDPNKSKILLEQCCTQGFKEAFNEIGYLELNYFQNPKKGQEWFKLGMELRQLQCFFGYFQCCIKLKDWVKAKKCIETINKIKLSNFTNELDKENISIFLQLYKNDINLIEEKLDQSIKSKQKPIPSSSQLEQTMSNKSKWGF